MTFLLDSKIFFVNHIYNPITKWYKNGKLIKKISRKIQAKSLNRLTISQEREIREFYKKKGVDRIDIKWHQFYIGCTDKFSVEYVPENIFYTILEPYLNQQEHVLTLSDKNLLDRLFVNIKQPETLIKNINGFFYSQNGLITYERAIEICASSEEMIIKPTLDTGGGKNVRSFICTNGITNNAGKSIEELLHDYEKNYVVQKKVKQHPVMASLNPSSLNTFRVMTYLTHNDVSILSVIVRMGRKGSITDNSSGGGISCGVGKDGKLNERGFEGSGDSLTKTDTGLKFNDIVLPFVDTILESVKKLHKASPYFRVISWDLGVDELGHPVLIEYNLQGQEINFHQLNNGPVLSPLLNEISQME